MPLYKGKQFITGSCYLVDKYPNPNDKAPHLKGWNSDAIDLSNKRFLIVLNDKDLKDIQYNDPNFIKYSITQVVTQIEGTGRNSMKDLHNDKCVLDIDDLALKSEGSLFNPRLIKIRDMLADAGKKWEINPAYEISQIFRCLLHSDFLSRNQSTYVVGLEHNEPQGFEIWTPNKKGGKGIHIVMRMNTNDESLNSIVEKQNLTLPVETLEEMARISQSLHKRNNLFEIYGLEPLSAEQIQERLELDFLLKHNVKKANEPMRRCESYSMRNGLMVMQKRITPVFKPNNNKKNLGDNSAHKECKC